MPNLSAIEGNSLRDVLDQPCALGGREPERFRRATKVTHGV